MVICCGEQLQQVLRTLQEVTEWVIAGQLARVNAGHLEEGEVSCRLHQVEEILIPPERRNLSPRSTRPAKIKRETSDEDSSWYEEAMACAEYLRSVDCFGWGPGITEF